VPIQKAGFLFKIKPPACRAYAPEGHAKKITAGICVIFLGLFFEHNAEAGQKDHFWRTLTKEVKKNNAILTS